jgi:hypothetical protein
LRGLNVTASDANIGSRTQTPKEVAPEQNEPTQAQPEREEGEIDMENDGMAKPSDQQAAPPQGLEIQASVHPECSGMSKNG